MPNRHKIILDLCGGTGSWSKPYKDAWYDVRIITLPKHDVKTYIPPENVYWFFAAPPCTMFSRARTTWKTPRDFKGAMEVVSACLRIIWESQYENRFNLKFWAMENPAWHLDKFMGKPAFKFQPYDFWDKYSKQTFIWGKFNEPKKNPVKLTDEEIIRSRNNTRILPKIPDNYERDPNMKTIQIQRSITPQGFAQAFFKANP